MKICILSMQRIENYGSFLQAYGLKKILNFLGHDVEFIDIIPGIQEVKFDNEIELIDYNKSKNIITQLKKFDKYVIKRIYGKVYSKKIHDMFVEYQNKYLELDKYLTSNIQYDVCVIGSDEVFNCMQHSPWGFSLQLFGKVDNCDKVITYAASCGFTKYENLSDEMKAKIKDAFKNVSCFSVRDTNTYELVNELSEKIISSNLDPVLIADFQDEIDSVLQTIIIPDNLCIIYAYPNRINDKKDIDIIKKFAKEHHLKLVSIGGYQKWVDEALILTPFEVLAYFVKAKFIITDTFHGTIFATRYNGRFATIIRDSNSNKLTDLVKRLKIENHVINSCDDLPEAFNIKEENSCLTSYLKDEQHNTLQYFSKFI